MRLRAFGNYAFRVADPKLFHTEISGTREAYTVAEVDGQLRGLVLQNISNAIASSGLPFLDLAANQIAFADALAKELQPAFAKIGLLLEAMTVQNVSLPERAAKDPRPEDWHGHGRQRHGQVHAVPDGAKPFPNLPKVRAMAVALRANAMGPGRRAWRWARCWRKTCSRACKAARPKRPPLLYPAAPVGVRPDEVMATLEKLGDLKAKGILTQEEFDAKKAELLKKLV